MMDCPRSAILTASFVSRVFSKHTNAFTEPSGDAAWVGQKHVGHALPALHFRTSMSGNDIMRLARIKA